VRRRKLTTRISPRAGRSRRMAARNNSHYGRHWPGRDLLPREFQSHPEMLKKGALFVAFDGWITKRTSLSTMLPWFA